MTRIVVTGTGMVSPIGNTAEETFAAALAGRANFRDHESLLRPQGGGKPCLVTVAGWPEGLDSEKWVPKKEARRTDPFIVYAIIAGHQAWESAGYTEKLSNDEGNTAGTLLGCGWNGVGTILDTWDVLRDRGPRRVSPFFIPSVIGNLTAGHIGMRFNLRGPNWTPSSAGASGAHAIGEGMHHIRDGRCDLMMTGGADGATHPMIISAFNNAGILTTTFADHMEAPVRPFDKTRDGTIISEGAGTLLLEHADRAAGRGAEVLCDIVGYSSVFSNELSWNPDETHMARVMQQALDDAGLKPEDIDYINPNGLGTQRGDLAEVRAIEKVFGSHAKKVAISSTKSTTGHMLGASGAVEAAICVEAIHSGRIPVNAGLKTPDFDLDFVTTAREQPVRAALSMNFGMGGIHTALVFKKA